MITETIKKRTDFLSISKKNESYYSKSTLILAQKTPEKRLEEEKEEDFVRVGYTVTKKIGNAVVRNKCKRRYREIFRKFAPQFALNNYDYSILARKEILKSDFKKIEADVKFCLKGLKRKLIEKNDQK